MLRPWFLNAEREILLGWVKEGFSGGGGKDTVWLAVKDGGRLGLYIGQSSREHRRALKFGF